MSINLAIISPKNDVFSETFIQAHKKLDARVFFYFGGTIPTELEGFGKLNKVFPKLNWYNILKKIGYKSKFSFSEWCLIKSFKRNNVQVVLAEYGPTGTRVMRVCKYLELPLIVHFYGHEVTQKDVLDQFSNRYKILFKNAVSVMAVSNKMVSDLVDLSCPRDKITLNTCGPADFFFDIQPSFASSQFIAIGRFVEKKAPYLTILAFKLVLDKFPKARLVMVGTGDLLGVCINLCKSLGIESEITFMGVLAHVELVKLYSESLAFLQHSIVAENGDTEGTPVAILEAAAAGLPVISTNHAGIPDVIIDGYNGYLVKELDVEGMAKKMEALLSNRTLAKQLGDNGKRRVLENFTMDRHLNRLNDVIRKSVNK